MPYFIECSTPSIVYLRGQTVENRPVNLDLCKSISKDRLRWYPDNGGRASIMFHGCDVEWAFNSDDARDAEYARIAAIKGQP